MEKMIQLQKKIAPEIFETLDKRYNILRNIHLFQPIGRRVLANKIEIGERIVRAETDFLKDQNMIEVSTAGMTVTSEGEEVIEGLRELLYTTRGIVDLEEKVRVKLGIDRVLITPGNLEEDEYVLEDLGKIAGKLIEKLAKDNTIIGVTGGTTMAAVGKKIPRQSKHKGIMVVPARGGLGREVENQANTISAEMARQLNADYRLLHASDTLGEKALESILQDPEIKEVIGIIKSADLLVFGIGRADKMAQRRELPDETVKKLERLKAVSEAFGYYFNRNGEIVHETNSIGIKFQEFQQIPNAIGVAGGVGKVEAILAISHLKKNMTLVTDEAAALEILKNSQY
ncbi:transcriptional regulator, DeoR family [Alkaliphilus metalliredigens QYMF]|uniref:Transcriptional regulator, DeoR family n=1 Tax=Alkaliphilus metalliredigens (strain QYMF) TaxID=293826 RepID=A6TU35_ALKMQ|nr:sugar-binding domain-containing protein [Alkaliphilus metalliredigens]ABR49703.1 transcriptional regulator, DeoR family [Alkaliphilus metalliredigens QYMF]